jgi:hypothetical protein
MVEQAIIIMREIQYIIIIIRLIENFDNIFKFIKIFFYFCVY